MGGQRKGEEGLCEVLKVKRPPHSPKTKNPKVKSRVKWLNLSGKVEGRHLAGDYELAAGSLIVREMPNKVHSQRRQV